MTICNRWTLIAIASSLLCTLTAGAQEPFRFQYSAKVVCGPYRDASARSQVLVPQLYATTINIHNPDPRKPIKLSKKLVLTEPPGHQKPGPIMRLGEDELGPDGALATDCADLRSRLPPTAPPLPAFFEGFVVVQSLDSLDVVGVYTAPGAIDVVPVPERRFGQ